MFTKTYEQTIQYLGETAPGLEFPTKFIKWAEDQAELLYFIYSVDYDTITEDIVAAAKEAQDWEGEED